MMMWTPRDRDRLVIVGGPTVCVGQLVKWPADDPFWAKVSRVWRVGGVQHAEAERLLS